MAALDIDPWTAISNRGMMAALDIDPWTAISTSTAISPTEVAAKAPLRIAGNCLALVHSLPSAVPVTTPEKTKEKLTQADSLSVKSRSSSAVVPKPGTEKLTPASTLNVKH